MAVLAAQPYWIITDISGQPVPFGKLNTYAATATTPKATFTDASGTVPASNPLIADAAGRVVVWGDGSYKFVTTDANNVPVGPNSGVTDNVSMFNVTTATFTGDIVQNTTTTANIVQTRTTNPGIVQQLADRVVQGYSSSGVMRVFTRILEYADSVTNGVELGKWVLQVIKSGVTTTEISVQNGVTLGAATGATPGTGAINATGYYRNGVAIASYESPEQTITAAGALTLAHGLGAIPDMIQYRLVCKVADLGYSINDIVVISGNSAVNGASLMSYSSIDATNINVRFSNGAPPFFINNKTTGVAAAITGTSWRLVVKAIKL